MTSPTEHIDEARATLAQVPGAKNSPAHYAIAHALLAIAEQGQPIDTVREATPDPDGYREFAVRNPRNSVVMTVPDNSLANAHKMAALVAGSAVMTRTVTEWAEHRPEPDPPPD